MHGGCGGDVSCTSTKCTAPPHPLPLSPHPWPPTHAREREGGGERERERERAKNCDMACLSHEAGVCVCVHSRCHPQMPHFESNTDSETY